MRTSELCHFENKISEINNKLSHTVFVFKQFSLDNITNIAKNPEELTTKIYLENEYASQFNVKLSKIEEQAQESLEYIFDTFFVFTNTQFEVYLKDVYLFVKNNTSIALGEPPETKVYETVLSLLGIDIEKDIDNLIVSTFDYFKFRRNAIMHRDKEKRFQGAMEDLIKGSFAKDKKKQVLFRQNQLNGTELNLKWKQHTDQLKANKSKSYTIQSFDFAKRDISKFNLNDLFDVFNFYRLYVSIIDKLILSKVSRNDLLKYCEAKHREFYGEEREKNYEHFLAHYKRTSKLVLNLNIEEDEARKIYNGA